MARRHPQHSVSLCQQRWPDPAEGRQVRKRGSFPGQPRRGAGSGVGPGGREGGWREQGMHLQAMAGGLQQLPEQLPGQLLPCGCPLGQLVLRAASLQLPVMH